MQGMSAIQASADTVFNTKAAAGHSAAAPLPVSSCPAPGVGPTAHLVSGNNLTETAAGLTAQPAREEAQAPASHPSSPAKTTIAQARPSGQIPVHINKAKLC